VEDSIDGGTGSDQLEGGDGDDIYSYSLGTGDDIISEFTYYWGSYNLLNLASGIAPADVRFARSTSDASDMVLTFVNGTGSIILDNQILGGREWGIDLLTFADGTSWDATALNTAFFSEIATAGNDSIDGSWIDNVIVGKAGNDVIDGRAGNEKPLQNGTGPGSACAPS
jgi:Ca2+-binding RTX toxin-like protein